MGDTRIDNDPYRYLRPPADDGCNDETKTCGETMSRGQPHEDPPLVVAQSKTNDIATIAKNLSDATYTAQYQKMSNGELDDAIHTLSKRLMSGTSYAGYAEDSARFDAAERVAQQRNAADPPKGATNEQLTAAKAREDEKKQLDEAWRSPSMHASENGTGVVVEAKAHDGDPNTLDARVEVSTANVGPQIIGLHREATKNIGGVDLTGSVDVGTVNFGAGFHNKDGSTGLHVGGSGTSVGVEGTAHKPGLGSITAGVSDGPAAEASVGGKKDGDTLEVCGRVSWQFFTVGACVPVWRM